MDLSKQPKDKIPPGAASVQRLEELLALPDEQKRRKKVYWIRNGTGTLMGEYVLYPTGGGDYHLNFNVPIWIFENYWYAYAYWLKKNHNGS